MLVPTKRFWLLFGFGLIVAGFAAQASLPFIAIGFDLLLLAMAFVTGQLSLKGSNLSITRRYDAVLSVRTPNEIELEILNLTRSTCLVRVLDQPPTLFEVTGNDRYMIIGPDRKEKLVYTVTPPERGSTAFVGTYLRFACPLGLVERQELVPTGQPVRVFPNVLALKKFDLLSQRGRLRDIGVRRNLQRGIGVEFESLKEYAVGDDYRKIDWKATARSGKLVVRQYETERNQAVIIVIDVGRYMLGSVNGVTKLDHALDACLLLAHAAQVAGDQVGLLVYADRVLRFIPPRKGRNQIGMIIEAIHDLVAIPIEPDEQAAFIYLDQHWKRRSLVITFTDGLDAERARSLAASLLPLRRRHALILTRVSDPHIDEVLEAPISLPADLFQRTAGLIVDEDRRNARAILENLGIFNVESEPQKLAGDLVNCYFTVKERGLI